MLIKIVKYFLSFFLKPKQTKKEDIPNSTNYDYLGLSSVSTSDTQAKKRTTSSQNRINVKDLERLIKTNIFFLDSVIEQMGDDPLYLEYKEKLTDLFTQSTGNLKILFRIKKEAPYYKKTIRTIYKHTLIINELTEFKQT